MSMSEPTNNFTSGYIGFTTQCFFANTTRDIDVEVEWLTVIGGEEKIFRPGSKTIKKLNGSCKFCNGDNARQFEIGFDHTEESGSQRSEAKFRLIVRHDGFPSKPLNVTTSNVYYVPVQSADASTSKWLKTSNAVILCAIIMCVLIVQYGILIMKSVITYMKRKRQEKETLPVSSKQRNVEDLRRAFLDGTKEIICIFRHNRMKYLKVPTNSTQQSVLYHCLLWIPLIGLIVICCNFGKRKKVSKMRQSTTNEDTPSGNIPLENRTRTLRSEANSNDHTSQEADILETDNTMTVEVDVHINRQTPALRSEANDNDQTLEA